MSLLSCPCCGLIQTSENTELDVCGRCESNFHSAGLGDQRNRLTLAMSMTALLLYVPAVTWKFLRIEQLGQRHESSLLQGITSLWIERQYFLGMIVLLFSIILPVVKLTALVFLCQPHWRLQPKHLAATYRVVEHLGRWGMLDVLLVAVMIAFIKLGGVVTFGAGPGVVLFGLYVLTSLSASLAFDPHSLWGAVSMESAPQQPVQTDSPRSPDVVATHNNGSGQFPTAKQKPPRRWTLWGVWLIPLATLLGVGGVTVWEWRHQPQRIEIRFQQGHGIKVGGELRYHGVVVGEIDQIRLTDSLPPIRVLVALTPDGACLARQGSRFWIVRPQFDLTGIAGLDTIVGAHYLAVQPGEADAPLTTQFRGLDEPPLPDLDIPGGVEVILESLDAQGLSPGTPVYYRRLRIGGVISSGLNLNQSRVEARAYIRPEYRHLIRKGTVFWNMSGVRFQGGLTELSLQIGSVEGLLQGGIGVAVPPNPGETVSEGYRYTLFPKADSEWFDWQPQLGAVPVPPPAQQPSLVSAQLEWTHDGLLSNSKWARTGWALVLNGMIHAPADLTTIPEDEITGTSKLTLGEIVYDEAQLKANANGSVRLAIDGLPANLDARTRPLEVAEDCFLMTGPDETPVFIAAGLIRSVEDVWVLEPELPLTSRHHGGVLVSHRDAALIGQVEVHGTRFTVKPLAQ